MHFAVNFGNLILIMDTLYIMYVYVAFCNVLLVILQHNRLNINYI